MRPDFELTSVPDWALAPATPPADLSGRSWTVIAFGSDGADIAARWCAQIGSTAGESAVRTHRFPDWEPTDQAAVALRADVGAARIGWRLMLAGPADACLRLRGVAVDLGVADDEMTVASTNVDSRAVHCVHCGVVTRAQTDLEATVQCRSCRRNLFVHYHVSRRSGTHLGFMADAERPA